jgi:hypothetical protein
VADVGGDVRFAVAYWDDDEQRARILDAAMDRELAEGVGGYFEREGCAVGLVPATSSVKPVDSPFVALGLVDTASIVLT